MSRGGAKRRALVMCKFISNITHWRINKPQERTKPSSNNLKIWINTFQKYLLGKDIEIKSFMAIYTASKFIMILTAVRLRN